MAEGSSGTPSMYELANSLVITAQADIISREQAGHVWKTYLKRLGLLIDQDNKKPVVKNPVVEKP